jgi:hypothetical protein
VEGCLFLRRLRRRPYHVGLDRIARLRRKPVHIAVLILRRDPVEHEHFRTPTFLPVVGALACGFLAGRWTGRDPVQYTIAGILLGIGVVLWVLTVLANRAARLERTRPEMAMTGGSGPIN